MTSHGPVHAASGRHLRLSAIVLAAAVAILLIGLAGRANAQGPVLFQGGVAVVEAEDFDAKVPRSGKDWTPAAAPAGAVGGSLQATPDSGARIVSSIAATSPELVYRVSFPSAGTHALWVRVHAVANGNSFHAGLDGAPTVQNASGPVGSWSWVKALLSVPGAGEHTVHLWMREDGLHVDRLLLTASGSFTPGGTGPAATPRQDDGPDVTPPTLTGRQPAPAATGVAVGADVVATFDEAMDPATLTSSTFTLAPTAGGPAVAASIAASAGDAVFTLDPDADLGFAIQYTATVTADATDAAGNPLAAEQSWSFTTAAEPPAAPGAVLFQDGLAVVEAEDFDTRVSRSSRSWTAGQSPAGAVGDALQAAPDAGTGLSGDIAAISPELGYRVLFPSAGSYRVWVRGHPPDGAGNSVYLGLDGAVGPSYLFNNSFGAWGWMGGLFGGGAATLSVPSAGAHVVNLWMREDGLHVDRIVVAADPGYTPAGAGPPATPRQDDGPDVTPPTLTGRRPAPAATGVAVGADVVATFDEAMDPATLTSSTFTLAPTAGGPAVAASIAASAGDTVFTLDPDADLGFAIQYTATVTADATDAAGNPLAAEQSWSFTTAPAPDTTPPTIVGRQPAPDAADVAIAADVVAAFDEAMDPATLTSSTFTLAPSAGGPAVSAGIAATAGNTVFTLDPASGLAHETQYTATVTTGATDAAGNALASAQSWSFTTAPAPPDVTAPTLVGRQPASGAAGVAVAAEVVATFSEAMDPATLSDSTFTLAPAAGGPAVSAAIAASAGNTTFTLTPDADLELATEYTAALTTAATDAAGNALEAQQTWSFTTTSVADATPPTLDDRQPSPGAEGVAIGTNVVATFSEPIDPATVTASSFFLAPSAGGPPVAASITPSPDGTSFILSPSSDLAVETAYDAMITTAVTDLAGNGLAEPQTWTFATVPTPGSGAVITADGLAVIEAEDFDFRIDRSGHGWETGQSPAGSVGDALRALPDSGARVTGSITTTSPEVSYRVLFHQPGAYRLWVRAYAVANGNSFHAGRDGEISPSTRSLATGPIGSWAWVNDGATISIPSAGEHTVNLWMREDGLNVDRLLLTTDAGLTPSGAGPAASPRSGAPSDSTPPALELREPAPGAAGVPVGVHVVAGFSEPMDPDTLTEQSFAVAPAAGGPPVAATIAASPGNERFTLDPEGRLAPETEYAVHLTTAVHDAAGNPLPALETWSFTTGPVDETPPQLVDRQPAADATGVNPVGAAAVATFSEPMEPATVSSTSFTLAPAAGGPPLPATITASAGGTVFTLRPESHLSPETEYTATVTTAATDLAENPLAAPESWSFTTGPMVSATGTEITTGQMLGPPFERRWFYVRHDGGPWEPTYAEGNVAAAGKLMNFRAANAIFDDENRADDDPEANTAEFISHFDEYRERGVLAYTVSLQGGLPGYEGALASAFTPDGSLRQPWLDRAAAVIEAADARGQVVILTYFYQRQDQLLSDGDAVRAATVNATDWLIARGYRNVIIEIANEHDSPLHDQEIISENRAENGVAELILLAKSRFDGLGYRLPVSVSVRDLDWSGALRDASDLALIHGNLTTPEQDAAATAALVAEEAVNGPVVMNEDFNGFAATPTNLAKDRASATGVFDAGGSWGLMLQEYSQHYPFEWALGDSHDVSGGSLANRFLAVLDHIHELTGESLPPALVSRRPAPGSLGVGADADVVAGFTKPMDPASVTAAGFSLAPAAGGPALAATIAASADDTTFTLDPEADLDPATRYTVTVTTAVTSADGDPLPAEESWSFTTAGAGGGDGPVTFVDGLAVFEAEDADAVVPRGGRDWVAGQSPPGAVGGALQVAPDSGGAVTSSVASTSPELGYRVAFPAAGTYRVWARSYPPDGAGNSVWLGHDGAVGPGYLFNNAFGAWGWMGTLFGNGNATVTVPSAGEHVINLWMREDGLHLDRIVVAADPGFVPTGGGPPATPRA